MLTVVNGAVYDLTTFIRQHPGGVDVVVDGAGGDSSALVEAVGHTAAARATMRNMIVTKVEGGAEQRVLPGQLLKQLRR